ncbi:MAG: hypothetical protein ACRCUT_11225, partial [Spirochaetota bacterium]
MNSYKEITLSIALCALIVVPAAVFPQTSAATVPAASNAEKKSAGTSQNELKKNTSVPAPQKAQPPVQKNSAPAAPQNTAGQAKTAEKKELPAAARTAPPVKAAAESDEEKKAKSKAAAEEKQRARDEFEKKADLKKAEWIEKTMEFGIQKDRKEAINFIPTVKDETRKKELGLKLITILDTDADSSILVKSLNIISELNLTEAVPSIKKHLSHMSE